MKRTIINQKSSNKIFRRGATRGNWRNQINRFAIRGGYHL